MAEFFAMGGYGFYVWSSFGMTALVLVVEVVSLRQRHKALIQRLNRMAGVDTGIR